MKGRWEVTSNHINGKKVYRVFRKKNADAVDHSGNREYAGEYCDDRKACEALARYLNEKEAEE